MKMFSHLTFRRCWQAAKSLSALTLVLLLAGTATPALAVHDVSLFELDVRAGMEGDQDKNNDPVPPWVGDGNTADDAVDGEDWENVYAGSHSADVISFIEDTFANNNINNGAEGFVALRTPEISFFTGGGSKDTNGIQDGPWKYKVISDQVPDKNDIVNAFAALYSQEAGNPILYFGLDTFSVNGDANAGFWFFRDDVSLAPLGEGENTGTFIGEHRDGDIFVAVAYTQGGRVGDIDVYQWSGDDATGGLVLMESGQDCATASPSDNVCGVINKLLPGQTFGEDPDFDYANTLVANNPLEPTSYQYESAAFVEFGLVLDSTLFPNGIGCFSTFMAETRSSQSETAQLKDLALGSFDVCSIDVVKTGDGKSKVGDDVDYSITVTNTGLATLYKQSISDTLLGDLSGDAGCGASLDPGASCTITVSRTVLAGDPDPLPNTVTVVYTELADPASLSFTANDDHSVDLFQPAIDVVKTGDTLSKVGDIVDYVITLSNNSSADTPDLTCTATETFGGQIYNGPLPAGDTVINFSRAVEAGDPNPLVNTVTLDCTVGGGFGNLLSASDSHSTDLFQPSITLDKTGDDLSKVGDTVDYTITLSNTSSVNTPDLECTLTDTMLGIDKSVTLASGASDVTNASYTVLGTDTDPLDNTANASCSPVGFSNVIPASDSHSVNLFQPAIDVAKTGDALSKVGDDVDYTITLSNNSSADTPDMSCVATDSLQGEVFNGVLPLGDTVINYSRTVLAADGDPLDNSVSMECTVADFGNVLNDSASHSTNLFQPSITFDKTGDTLSKVGDDVNYVITLNNTSSADTPDMDCTITDAMLGINKSVTLASGASDVTNAAYTVLGTDTDPLDNTANASCSPIGFANVLPASDSHSVDLFQPAIDVAKTGDALSKVGDDVDYTITLSNNSSADTPDLNCTATDSLMGEVFSGVLPLGDTVINTSRTVLASDVDPLINNVTMDCTVAGFGNALRDSASHSTDLFQPAINVAKSGDALSKVGDDVDYTITLSNNSSADTPDLTCVATDNLLGEVYNGVLPLGDTVLNNSRTVQAGDGDPLVNSVSMVCTVGGGFGNVLNDSDSHNTNLFQPGLTIDKTADCDLDVPIGALITYNYLITNTSSADTPDLSLTSISDDKVGDL
uniref:DUF7507 domain-containing protein n=1 Tax=Amphritea sp. TaxID=1872502 RepID=UPI003567F0CE